MAKSFLVCYKSTEDSFVNPESELRKINTIFTRLSPDNINPNKPIINYNNALAYGVMNPQKSIKISKKGICLGYVTNKKNSWDITDAKNLVGTFSIFRWDKINIELVTDAVASRTIWYTKTSKFFIASNSQRAVIMFLKDFKLNRESLNWMLTTGTIGPNNSWDKRIKPLENSSSLVLDRKNWKITINKLHRHNIKPTNFDLKYYKKKLQLVCSESIKKMDIPQKNWVLSLSGGYDSRAILLLMKSYDIRLLNWGLKSSDSNDFNDTSVPFLLAKHFKKPIYYFENDMEIRDCDIIFDRFFRYGEGRVDHIGGYTDGFKMYKELFENNIHVIIRGDEAFGWEKVNSAFDVKRCLGLLIKDDYSNLPDMEDYGLPKVTFPSYFERKSGESLAIWRDRLYREYRIPSILSALNELKAPYVELVNPFLSNDVLNVVNEIPDHLRTDKILFKKIIRDMSPEIPFTSIDSSESRGHIIQRPQVIEMFLDELCSNQSNNLFSHHLINYLKTKIEYQKNDRPTQLSKIKLYNSVKKRVPKSVKLFFNSILSRPDKIKMNYNLMLFRFYIILKMVNLFKSDIHFIKDLNN